MNNTCECGREDGCHVNKYALLEHHGAGFWDRLLGGNERVELNIAKARKCVRFVNEMKEQYEAAKRIVK